jgi:nicotinamide riboside kinase
MTRPGRIGLIGGECSGKTTLAGALAEVLSGCVVDEQLRVFVEKHGRPPRAGEQGDVLRAQISHEDEGARTCARDVLIVDPAALMTAVYSLSYYNDSSLIDEAVEHARHYDLVVWCDIDLPWEADPGQRDGPDFRARVHELLASIVAERLEPAGIRVVLVSGDVAERIGAVTRAWQPEAPIEPT